MDIGFIGLGAMGAGVAGNLVKAGHAVTVWNRTASKADALVAAGARLAETPKAAATGMHIVFSILADDPALQAVLDGGDGLLAGLPKGALHISLSTISVAMADHAARLHQDHGQRYMSAPVFGRPEAAAAGKLFIVAAGATADLDEAAPVFAAISQKVFRIGETPSHANLIKLCGNFTILAAIEAMAEGMALAEKGGVPKAKLLEVLTGTLFDSPVYKNYGAALVEDRFTPAGFKAPLALKDMRLVGEAAEKNRVAMPLLSLLRDHLLETLAKEGEDIDWSGIGRTVARNAGL
ncbi:NAD(P)-dependent oxidoreductase [Beijerinckia sp. L45]|uniref:NAD(P)-dependent oxidoreductase n=1 Tax=Beijerinckia sp. L45 TaxID=1641855 RepID=UPI00131D32F7|nr:NAD(P)-dependent oxidoreductase [Beijerinckia sp. L45]